MKYIQRVFSPIGEVREATDSVVLSSALITHGVFNLTHHQSHEFPETVSGSEKITIRFCLDQIAYQLPAGHRMRLAVSTSYWPTIWPSPVAAQITLHEGKLHLPIRAANAAADRPESERADEWEFEDPQGSPHWRTETLREASYSRHVDQNESDQTCIVSVDADSGEVRDLEHGLISGSWMKERFYIVPDDPLSARVTAEWEQTGGREGAMWRTHVWSEMTCDADHLFMNVRLIAHLNDEVFFEKSFDETVKRDHF